MGEACEHVTGYDVRQDVMSMLHVRVSLSDVSKGEVCGEIPLPLQVTGQALLPPGQ